MFEHKRSFSYNHRHARPRHQRNRDRLQTWFRLNEEIARLRWGNLSTRSSRAYLNTIMASPLVSLEPDAISRQITETRQQMERYRQTFKPSHQLRTLFRSNHPDFADGNCAQRWFMHHALELARLEHAAGASPSRIRELLHEAISVYAPVVPQFDYSPRKKKFAVHASHLNKFEGGKRPPDLDSIVTEPICHPMSEYKFVHVTVKNQPGLDAMKEAMICALIAWDFDDARTMAENYPLEPRFGGDAPNRFGLFREAILGNADAAIPFLGRTLAYSTDRPPERHELAEGVIRGDASLVRKGLKTVSARFKSIWTLKTYRTPAKLRYYRTEERMLPDIRRHLMTGTRWLMADWAIAWMSLAWHQGMKEAFSDQSLFSKWVPWELCCPEPLPAA